MAVLDEVRDLAEAVARRRSLNLWDIEIRGGQGSQVVRVFVHDPGGVDLATVAEVSEELSRGLDLKDPIPGRYTLEVSTPGLERPLKRPDHFVASVGMPVVLKTNEVLVGNSHRIEGSIKEADETAVRIDTGDRELDLPYDALKSARTVFEWGTGSET
jgi:ribosome maturation factor RimP